VSVVRLARRHSTALWIAAGVVLAILLRIPWLDAPLNRDEGGDALIAQAWGHGPFAYGHLFLDRPPLLLALYRLGGDTTGIRIIGAVAAALLVVTTTLLATRVAGRRAAPYAAAITALLASSFALRAVLTPAELLAAVPASAAILLLVMAFESERRKSFLLLVASGALAATALLIKQSFADALAAGAVAIVVAKLTGASWRETGRRAAGFASGIALTGAALTAWALATHTTASQIWFALFGFRLDATHALAGSKFGGRFTRLDVPILHSGLAIAIPVALIGIALLKVRPAIKSALFAWLLVAGVGILLGGSYWPHYMIAVVSVTAVGCAALLARHTPIGLAAVAALAAAAIVVAEPTALHDGGDRYDRAAVTVADYLHARAMPGESAYVLYTNANVLYYSGLKPAFPYNWSLMMESIPGAVSKLRHDLASPQKRPTWLVEWQTPHAFGLDRNGLTKRLVARNYRPVAKVCGHRLLLARGAPERPLAHFPLGAGACANGPSASAA
jgi:4-amino-4-deoxy-L-arabinose transferase-like glycosyltransferase